MTIKTFKINLQLFTTFILIISASFKLNAIIFSNSYNVYLNDKSIASIEKQTNDSEYQFTISFNQPDEFIKLSYSENNWFPYELFDSKYSVGDESQNPPLKQKKRVSFMDETTVFFMGKHMENLFNKIIKDQLNSNISSRIYTNFTFMNSFAFKNTQQVKPFEHTLIFAPICKYFTHDKISVAGQINKTNQKVTYKYKIDSGNKIIESVTVYNHDSKNTLLFSAVTTNLNDFDKLQTSSPAEHQQLSTNIFQQVSQHPKDTTSVPRSNKYSSDETNDSDNIIGNSCETHALTTCSASNVDITENHQRYNDIEASSNKKHSVNFNPDDEMNSFSLLDTEKRNYYRSLRIKRSIDNNIISKNIDERNFILVKSMFNKGYEFAGGSFDSAILEVAIKRINLDIIIFIKKHLDKNKISIHPFNILETCFSSLYREKEIDEFLIDNLNCGALSSNEKKAIISTVCDKHSQDTFNKKNFESVAISRINMLFTTRTFNGLLDYFGRKTLFYMIAKKDLECIRNIFIRGDEVAFYNLSNDDRNDFFHKTIKENDSATLNHLLFTMKVDFNVIDNDLFDSIFTIAINIKSLDIMKYIIPQLENAKESNIYKVTHLINAIQSDNKDIVKYLIEQKLYINAPEQDTGMTPLHCAAGVSEDITRLLIKEGANVNALNKEGSSPLCFAISKDIALILLENKADLNIKTSSGGTLIHHAVGHNNIDLLEYFISLGLDIKCTNDNGDTPLHVATNFGYKGMVRNLLTNHHANVNATNNDGRTSLDVPYQNLYSEYYHNTSCYLEYTGCDEDEDELNIQNEIFNERLEISNILIKAGGIKTINYNDDN